MTERRQPGVLGSLPRTRPHRRSDKRPAAAASATVSEPVVSPAEVMPEPKRAEARPRVATAKPRATAKKAAAAPVGEAKPRRTPASEAATPPPPAPVPGTLETAVQAAAELAEIGLQASARVLRRTLSRLPRP